MYGKLTAKNSEIRNATTIANCNEFIDKGQLESIDDSNQGLLTEMQNNKATMEAQMGAEKYKENIETLQKLVELDVKKGLFATGEGDIDSREKNGVANWNDDPLNKGYEIQCGLKGGKLSGG